MSSNASLNHIFRTVWNQSLGAMVAVAETSGGAGKSSGTAARGRQSVRAPNFELDSLQVLALSIAVAWGGLPALSWANPSGAVAIVGQANLETQGSRLLVTTQNGAGTNHSAINWQTFSIPAGQSTFFQQPSTSSTSINRVVSNTPSLIFGSLGSNGNLVLVNQSGITVGAGAVVDTAAFTASALAMSDANALAGSLRFGDGSAAGAGVSVQGHILARSGDVVLLGLDISTSKDALIQSPNGSTLLAAGQKIALTGRGLEGIVLEVQAPGNTALNLGTLQGDAVGVFSGTLKHSGDIQATAVSVEGGRVMLKALAQASVAGSVAAQRADGSGGNVEVRGADIEVGSTANIVVDAAQLGDGGRVLVLAGNSTHFDGSISAKAGTLGGNGGFVETSGAQLQVGDTARVSTAAPKGLVGNWLLDPTDFTIAASGGNITGAALSASLAATNMTETSADGDVVVNDLVTWSGNKLTLNAAKNIRINSVMTATGSASLALVYGQGEQVASNSSQIITGATGKVNLPAGTGNFTTLQGLGGVVKNYTVITSLGTTYLSATKADLQGMQGGSTLNYALGADINAAATSSDITSWLNTGFVPIVGFSGSLDGLGHTVSNLHIANSSTAGAGLLGSISLGGEVRNLGLVNPTVGAQSTVGALVGINLGRVANSFSSGGTVTGGSDGLNVGGLVGQNSGVAARITNSYATSSVQGNNIVGGLVGFNDLATVETSFTNSSATVTGNTNLGGLVGANTGTILNSHASGNVTGLSGATNVGGLAGMSSGRIESTATGSASSTYATGNVAAGSEGSSIGGLVGYEPGGTILNAYASGDVSAPLSHGVGGLVGGAGGTGGGVITGSSATGSVSGATYVGGLVGVGGYTVSGSYATGAVSGGNWVGGLFGATSIGGNIGTSYAAGNVSGSSDVGGLVGFNNLAVVADTYASGVVNGYSSVGGLLGSNSGSVSTSYAAGTVSGTAATGGFVGLERTGSYTNNYFVPGTTANTGLQGLGDAASSPNVTARTSATMRLAASFGGFDLTGTGGGTSAWRIYEGNTTPLLRSLLKPLVLADTSLTYNGNAQSGATATGASGSAASGIHVSAPYSSGYWSTQLQGYDISGGSLTITPQTLTPTITSTGVTKVYDGTRLSTLVPTFSFVGLVSGDTDAGLASTVHAYDTAHVATASKVTVFGLSITGIAGSHGSLPTDYVLDANSKDVGATITARPLNATAVISPVAKVYDGLLVATGSTVAGSLSGMVGTDVVQLDTSGLALNFSDTHVASTGKTIGATGAAVLGSLSSSGSGALDGSNSSNLVVSLAGDYGLAAQPGISTVAGVITAKTLSSTATITAVAKTFDGLLAASTSTIAGSTSGALNGDTVELNTSGLFLDNNTAHAGATTVTATGNATMGALVGGGIGAKDGSAGNAVAGLAGDYGLAQPTITNQGVAGVITAKQLVATASIGGVTSKTYDGTLAASGATVNGSTTGAVGTDSVALDTSGLKLSYSDAHVATAGKTIGATGTVAKGALTSSGSGAKDGSNGANLVVAQAGDYELSLQPTIAGVSGSITPRSVSATASIGGTLSKVYDGTTTATAASVTGLVNGAIAGDALVLDVSPVLLAYNSGDVASAHAVLASGTPLLTVSSSASASQAGDYALVAPSIANATASITPRAVSHWLATSTGQWSQASNWDVLPSSGNVLSVSIPAGATVVFGATAASTSLEALNSLGTLAVTGSNLSVTNALNTANYSQSGGAVNGAGTFSVGNSFSQTAGSIAMGGAVSIRQASGNLAVGSISGSSIALQAVNGAISQTAPLVTPGSLQVAAANGVTLTDAGNAVSAFGAVTTSTGDVAFTNVGALNVVGVTVANGALDLDNTGGLLTSGAISVHGGGVDITTHSPLVINNTVTADGSITLAALSPNADSNILINGAMNSTSGGISVQAYNNFVQNANLSAAQAIAVAAGGVVAFGPNASSVGNPVGYTSSGVPYLPPWISATLSGGATDFVATFLDQFQTVLDAQPVSVDDPLGIKQRAKGVVVVVEGELCKP